MSGGTKEEIWKMNYQCNICGSLDTNLYKDRFHCFDCGADILYFKFIETRKKLVEDYNNGRNENNQI